MLAHMAADKRRPLGRSLIHETSLLDVALVSDSGRLHVAEKLDSIAEQHHFALCVLLGADGSSQDAPAIARGQVVASAIIQAAPSGRLQ